MRLPALQEQALARELRGAWASRHEVRLTLNEQCMIRTVVGLIRHVSVTGAFATIDGWHIPLAAVLATGKPTIADRDAYRAELQRLQVEHPDHFRTEAAA